FTLSVVRPESCGIGGGGFMVIHLSSPPKGGGPADIAINYRETAPAGVRPDYYEKLEDPRASTHGAKAVGTPGTVAGVLYALEHYGTLDRATVLAPAIRAAEEGFQADPHYIAEARALSDTLEAMPGATTRFAFVWKHWLHEGHIEAGDLIRIPGQAEAL